MKRKGKEKSEECSLADEQSKESDTYNGDDSSGPVWEDPQPRDHVSSCRHQEMLT